MGHQQLLELKGQKLFSWFLRWYFSFSLAAHKASRAENIQRNKDQAHRLKGVLRDSIVMLEQVGGSVRQSLSTFTPVWICCSPGWENIYCIIIWINPSPRCNCHHQFLYYAFYVSSHYYYFFKQNGSILHTPLHTLFFWLVIYLENISESAMYTSTSFFLLIFLYKILCLILTFYA